MERGILQRVGRGPQEARIVERARMIWSSSAWAWFLTLPLSTCVTLSESLSFIFPSLR